MCLQSGNSVVAIALLNLTLLPPSALPGPAPCLVAQAPGSCPCHMLKSLCLASGTFPLTLAPTSGSPLCSWPVTLSPFPWALVGPSVLSLVQHSAGSSHLPQRSLWSGSSMTFTLPNPVADCYKWISTVPAGSRGPPHALPDESRCIGCRHCPLI